ncbi:MAG: hypothetical protein ACJA08_002289 [Cyclobacteriaceae bacterium]|jgi:hypothetical protein
MLRPYSKKIEKSPLHKSIMTLFNEEIESREYPEWSMAYRDLKTSKTDMLDGYNDLLNRNYSKEDLDKYSIKVRAFMGIFKD